jgi:hypothetical protein
MVKKKKKGNKLSSNDLAVLIVDALIDENIISKEDLDKSIEIVIKEIEAREALGDY